MEKKVLLITPQDSFGESVNLSLTKKGRYDVVWAENPAQALELARQQRISRRINRGDGLRRLITRAAFEEVAEQDVRRGILAQFRTDAKLAEH